MTTVVLLESRRLTQAEAGPNRNTLETTRRTARLTDELSCGQRKSTAGSTIRSYCPEQTPVRIAGSRRKAPAPRVPNGVIVAPVGTCSTAQPGKPANRLSCPTL